MEGPEIKVGYIYTAIASTFATTSVVKRGTHVRVDDIKTNLDGRGVTIEFTDPLTDRQLSMPRWRFENNFIPFEPTIVSPIAG